MASCDCMKGVHGKRNSKRWKKEIWQLRALRAYEECSGTCWANARCERITKTQALAGGPVSKQCERLRGTPSKDKDGRFDLVVGLPGFGKVYLHILVWFHCHNDGQFNSWKAFRGHCLRTGQDVDHGEKGERQRHADGWRTVIDVQSLS